MSAETTHPRSASTGARIRPGATAGRALLALSLCTLLSSLGTSIANVGLPTFARVFGASFQSVQWVVLSYLLAITVLIVGAGRLGDMVGRRRLLLAGIVLFTLSSAACALAPSLGLLIAARAAQGTGAAAMMALSLAYASEAVVKDRMGAAMGLLGTVSAVGTALGPTLGGLLIDAWGWRSLFVVNLPLGGLALVLVARHLPLPKGGHAAPRGPFDWLGMFVLSFALCAYALAMTLGRSHFGVLHAALALGAAVLAAAFARIERSRPQPLIDLSLLRDRSLSAGLAATGLVSTVMMATLVVGPFYLARALGLPAALVGLAMSVGPLFAALAGVPAGRMVDRIGSHRSAVAGLAAMAVASLLLCTTPLSFGMAGYVVPLSLLTSGYALFQAANNTAIMRDLASDRRGLVSGLLNLARNLGLVTGAAVLGAVFAFATGADVRFAAPTAIAHGMRATFGLAAVLVAAALAIASRGRTLPVPPRRQAS